MIKKIISDSRVQTLISVLIVFAAYIVSTLQGVFGIIFPFILLTFFILTIIFVYYIAIVPVVELLKPKAVNSERIYDMARMKEYELTIGVKEIWVITSNLKLASDKNQFGATIYTNISRGVKYKFFINDNNIAKERATEMVKLYNKANGLFEIYLIPEDLPFVDDSTDYDLFFMDNMSDNKGFIGITIDNKREYVAMSPDLFIKLKLFITTLGLDCWNASSVEGKE